MTDQEMLDYNMQSHRRAVGNYEPAIEAFGEAFKQQETNILGWRLKVVQGEDLLLVEVLQKHLGRLVTDTDFKDCEMKYFEGKPDEYRFFHKGTELGMVKRETKIKFGYVEISDPSKNIFSIQHVVTFSPKRV